jgi:UDP-N-acetylmuramate: L-alanyl-gamma-D-glutamyl-meso-diaminopimelate ligase
MRFVLSAKLKKMRIHFIAIGGSVMHNLAIALKLKGYNITGSDDAIFEPASSNLAKHGLLPTTGWDESKVDPKLDAVVLGMHAKPDNPELAKAKALSLKIYSFPEFIYEQSKNKKRIVIGGSHGKTTITAMILHILSDNHFNFDYMVGAALPGFELTVRLSDLAPVIILEGDEYPDSAINKIPKFHIYKPDIALLSGIAWDHINVFETFEKYVSQFDAFVQMIPDGGSIIYNSEDQQVRMVVEKAGTEVKKIPYSTPPFEIINGVTYLMWKDETIPLRVFGRHNLQNMMGAISVCMELGIKEEDCVQSIKTFSGAARRLELVAKNQKTVFYRDFAHSPSKLKATIAAVREQYPEWGLAACMELHTYSSLDKAFLHEYRNSMTDATIRIVFFDEHSFTLKKMDPLEPAFIRDAFGDPGIIVFTHAEDLKKFLHRISWENMALLMMSSGNFGGLDLKELSTFVVSQP